MANTTFVGGNPTWANACVGDNGFINFVTYAEGYSKAANLILDHVLNNHGKYIDSFIYPICFNMRHSIELRIKGAIQELKELADIKKVKLSPFDLVGSHDIGNIWIYFKEKSESLDLRFILLNDLLDKTIFDIAEIDSTGQTFRYPFDIEDKKHLTEQRIISCSNLKFKFTVLETNLNNLKSLCDSLIEEYKIGTFTKKFSRAQIFKFAKELPLIEKWKSDLNKQSLCSKYNLTSNDLTKILNLIKNNYEISALIGLKKNLIVLQDNQILDLCEIWANKFYPEFRKLYSEDSSSSSIYEENSDSFQEMNHYYEKQSTIYRALEPKLNIDYVADVWALFYLSRNNLKYSEEYFLSYGYYRQDIQANNSLLDSFDHVFSKTNFLEEIIKSLYFLNQIDLAEEIIKATNLEPYFDFIPKARNRELFYRWDLLGYEN